MRIPVRKRYIAASLLLIVGLLWIWDPLTTRIPAITTNEWSDIPYVGGGLLYLRRERDPDGALLLRYLPYARMEGWVPGESSLPYQRDAVIYRFVPEKNLLETLGINEWEGASGNIAGFDPEASCSDDKSVVYGQYRRLLINGRPVPTAARLYVGFQESPDCKLVAVLSASGPEFRGSMVFGGHRIYGTRYHEVLHTEDATPVGGRFILKGAGRWDLLTPVWSADGKYVVYVDNPFLRVWIVPVNK